ncbi:hypothetical protein ACFL3V_04430 [Nanoarchaeota archaeon]
MAKGAIAAIIIFIFGLWFAIPSQANIGYMLVESMDDSLCDENTKDNAACKQMWFYKLMMSLIGVLIIVGDVAFIVQQVKRGNFL